MYPDWVSLSVIFAAFFIWLCILTYLYNKQSLPPSGGKQSLLHSGGKQSLPPRGGKQSLPLRDNETKQKLDEVMEAVGKFAKREEFFAKVLKEQALEGLGHIQRVQ